MATLAKNIAVVGCGAWGQNHVRTTHDLGALYAVSDYDPKRTEEFAQKYNVKGLTFDEALKDNAINGIILATPAPLHAKMALEAIAAGKHVLVEKPIALKQDDALRMITAANDASRVLMVGHVLQYHPAFLKLKDMVAKGELGTLKHIYSNRLNFGKVRTEENVFWSFAPHDVSMVLALAGREPTAISAQYSNGIPGNGPASTAMVQFGFGENLNAHIHVSWQSPFKEQKLVVIGDKGMAVFDDTLPLDKKLAFFKNSVSFENGQPVLNKAEPQYIALPDAQPLKEEVSHFATCIASGAKPFTDGNEAMRVLKVMQECDKAAGL